MGQDGFFRRDQARVTAANFGVVKIDNTERQFDHRHTQPTGAVIRLLAHSI